MLKTTTKKCNMIDKATMLSDKLFAIALCSSVAVVLAVAFILPLV